MNIPAELIDNFSAGNGALFVGAGVSRGAGLPTWARLVDAFRSEIPNCPGDADFLDVAHFYEILFGRHRLIARIRECLNVTGLRPTEVHRRLLSIPVSEIFTTNYDDLLEQTCRFHNQAYHPIIMEEDIPYSSGDELQIIKLHGDLMRPASIVITSRDYERYLVQHRSLVRTAETAFQRKTVLFLGYSANDPNLRHILSCVRHEVEPHARNLFIVQLPIHDLRRQDLEVRGLRLVSLRNPEQGETYDQVIIEWLDSFTETLAKVPMPPPRKESEVLTVSGKIDRTRHIVSVVRDYSGTCRVGTKDSIVRLWQGFSSLSLGDQDHPEDPEYSNLLRAERDAFMELFEAGCDFRVIVSRRPLFTDDMYEENQAVLQSWSKWLIRCRNLLGFIQKALNDAPKNLPLIVYTPHTYLSDFALGEWILVKGSKTDTGPSYNSTVFTRRRATILHFIDDFDRHLSERIEAYARDLGVRPSASLSPEQMLRHSLEKIQEIEKEIASRTALLKRVV